MSHTCTYTLQTVRKYQIPYTYPLQKGSDVPLERTAVRLRASLIKTWSSPRFAGLFGFLRLITCSDVTNFRETTRSPLYVRREVGATFWNIQILQRSLIIILIVINPWTEIFWILTSFWHRHHVCRRFPNTYTEHIFRQIPLKFGRYTYVSMDVKVLIKLYKIYCKNLYGPPKQKISLQLLNCLVASVLAHWYSDHG